MVCGLVLRVNSIPNSKLKIALEIFLDVAKQNNCSVFVEHAKPPRPSVTGQITNRGSL